MKRSKIKDWIYTVVFMLGVTLVTVSAVSGLHLATRDLVERNEDLFIRKAILRAARIEIPDTPAEAASLYDELVSPLPGATNSYIIGKEDSKYAFIRSGAGLWGEITAVVCFSPLDNSLVGVTFTKQNETPGLGARIEEKWFQEQFYGKKGPVSLMPEGTVSTKPDEIDAITGATITSKAVRDIVNRTTEELEAMPQQREAM